MNDQTNRRKRQHIEVIGRDEGVERNGRFFDAMSLQHRAMPEINLADVDPSIEIMGKRLSFPLLISSMTGPSCSNYWSSYGCRLTKGNARGQKGCGEF